MKEIEIPEGYAARIEGNKVIFESEYERARNRLIDCLKFHLKGAEEQDAAGCSRQKDIEAYKWGIALLEKQKEQQPAQFKGESLVGNINEESEYDKGYRAGIAYQLKQTEQYKIGKTFTGLIPCWVNAPSKLQPAHKYHGRNAVIMHENNGGFRCCFIDDEKATTVHLPEDTLFVEGWRKKSVEWSEEDEEMIARICANLEYLIKEAGCDSKLKEKLEERIKWMQRLKSLRPQPKQESEPLEIKYVEKIYKVYGTKELPGGVVGYIIEDEPGHYDCIIHPDEVLGGGYGIKSNGSPYPTKEANFGQPYWKPSEEQMDRLGSIVAALRKDFCDDMADFLASLYHDLQKLLQS